MHKVPPAPPFNLAASSSSAPVFNLAASSSLGPLHRATSSAPTKKRAPPGSAAAPKKVYSNPYTVFCQEQRPLLPRSLRNSQREWTLGQMWKSLPDEEKAKYKPEEGTVRKASVCSSECMFVVFGSLSSMRRVGPFSGVARSSAWSDARHGTRPFGRCTSGYPRCSWSSSSCATRRAKRRATHPAATDTDAAGACREPKP